LVEQSLRDVLQLVVPDGLRIESNVLFTRTREVSLSATTPPRQSISPSTTALRSSTSSSTRSTSSVWV